MKSDLTKQLDEIEDFAFDLRRKSEKWADSFFDAEARKAIENCHAALKILSDHTEELENECLAIVLTDELERGRH